METLKTLIPILITASLALIVFGIGLKSGDGDLAYVLRRPKLLAKALIAVSLVPMLVAMLVVGLFGLTYVTAFAILLMAISPVPPLVPGKEMKRHPRMAMGLAGANDADALVTSAILLFLLVGVVAVVPYQAWVKRHRQS